MICEVCHGIGIVLRRAFTGQSPGRLVPRPCPECNGSGLAQRRNAGRWPSGVYGHADYELGYAEGEMEAIE